MLVCVLAGALLAAPSAAAPLRALSAQPYETAAVSGGQVVTFDGTFLAKLGQVPMEETVEVEDWPVAPGVSAQVTLTRHDIYAPEARLYRVEASGPVEIPRSTLAFFTGRTVDGGKAVWLTVEPGTNELWGGASVDGDLFELRAAGGRRYTVASVDAFLPEGARSTAIGCGAGDLQDLAGSSPTFLEPKANAVFPADKLSTLHTATVAVDTDNELMLKKFSNNTTSANNYVGQLLTAMNVMYERDLKVRLLQGTTFFRVSTTADPYTQGTGGAANGAQLDEFEAVWIANHGSVQRALAMMLSGKQSATNSASGIANIDGLCSASRGYSFSQVFNSPAFPASQDAYLVGHELGHNFGSNHTHCYSPPIDGCTNFEANRGCFSGTPACPAATTINGIANVRGTIMSYCGNLGGCSATNTFHPRTMDVINPLLASRVGICLFPQGTGGAASRFYTVPPCRLIDTRRPTGLLGGPGLAALATRPFTVTGSCGIPADAKAVSGNITVAAPLLGGFLNAYPTGTPTSISLVSYRAGQVKANNIVLKLPASGGSLTFQNGASALTHFLFDVNGYFK